MSYVRRKIYTRGTVEVEEYFSNRIGNHDKRAKAERETPEQVKEAYYRRRRKHLRWLLNNNFQDGSDALVTLSWRKDDKRPDTLEEVKEAARGFFRRLRETYKSIGRELKYIYCVEIGPKGSRHIHAVISDAGELPNMTIMRSWGGVVNIKPLYTGGEYDDLADYMVKNYVGKTEKTLGETLKRCFECSRNLQKPVIEIERIKEKDIRKDIEPPEGYVLDRSTVQEGVDKVNGRPYRFYRFKETGQAPGRIAPAQPKPDPPAPIRIPDAIKGLFERGAAWLKRLTRRK